MAIVVERVPNRLDDLPVTNLDLNIYLDDGSVLGSDVLRLQSFSGTEGISQSFAFQLEIRANDYTFGGPTDIFRPPPETGTPSKRNYPSSVTTYPAYGEALEGDSSFPTVTKLDFDQILGSAATVSLGLAKDTEDESNKWTYFNGIITSISMSDRGCYQVEMKPKLSLLGLQSHYRAFEGSTIVDVLSSLLEENNIDFTFSEPGSDNPNLVTGLGNFRKQDWLQMGETDADFFNRLLEKAGLFYYFIHSESKHEMVITDINYYQTLFESEESDEGQTRSTRKLYLSYSEGTQQREDYITQFNYKQNLMPGVFTTLAQKQSAWQEQATAAVSPIFPDNTLGGSSLNIEQLQMVAFGASEHEVSMRNSVLQKQLLTGKMALTGSSTCPEMRCGYKFQLADSAYHRTAQDESDLYAGAPEPIRRELDGVMMVASSVTHNASVDGKYSNQFEAIDAKGHGKAFAPTGDQLGSVLAIVCDSPLVETPEAQRSRKYLPKTDFVGIETQNFSTNTSDEVYTARGVYVRLVTQSDSEDPIWIRLRDDLSTIPERGVYVIVARSSDETEIPELQQILESKGSKNIMPESYTVNTSWGDSYSTSYGDSQRISLSGSAVTSIDDAREVVENATQSSAYDDNSFGETSPSSVNLSPKSYSLSISGSIPPSTDVGSLFKASDGVTDPDGVTESDYKQYSRSINFGNSYSKNETYGEQKSITTNHGLSYNETYERGGSDNYTEQWGHQNSVTLTQGTSYNETTTYEEQTSITTNHGKQTSTTTNNDHSHNETYEHGGSHNYTEQWGHQSSETLTHDTSYNKTTQTGNQKNDNYMASTEDYTHKAESKTTTITGASNTNTIDGVTFDTKVAGMTNSISMTGITTTIDIEASTNYIRINGPGIRFENGLYTPKAEMTSLKTQITGLKITI